MTLPANPPITMDQVYAEFGAPAGTPLHAFVRGGSYVPNISQNNGVPTAPPITQHQLCGATKYIPVSATVSPTSASGVGTGPNASGMVATNNVTAAGHNGHGSYTYSWSAPVGLNITNPNGATTNFSRSVSSTGSPYTATATCTVSDGTSSAQVNVPVTLEYSRG